VDRRVGAVAVLHPFPSLLNALVTASLTGLAGGGAASAITLAAAMAGFQVSIGALNDLVDFPGDAVTQPWKPIPSGLVTTRAAAVVVVAGGCAGALLSVTFGPAVLAVGIAGYGCGVGYDLVLKRLGLGWVAFSLALPLLLCYPWLAATGTLPPRSIPLLPIALVAGPALHLANSLVDLEKDQLTGVRSLAVVLGRRRAVTSLAGLLALVHGLAWISLLGGGGTSAVVIAASTAASILGGIGLIDSASADVRRRAWGWSAQAVSTAGLGIAWLAAATAT